MRLWSELKRRNVVRVALFYLIAAWVVVQVAETVLPLFEVPEGVLRGLVVLLAIGFVPALVLAWVFELTPEGIKRESDPAVSAETRPRPAQKLNWATLVVALLAIGLLVFDRLQPAPDSTAAISAPATGQSDEAPRLPAQPEVLSIAVLPFVNMSPDADNEYFADGVSEEILNLLAQTGGLRVAGRTSAFKFKGHNEDLRVIGEQLGVGHILEGSVRKAGDRVRITAQLVQVTDGFHLWSDTYDRRLDDIFAVQDEIGGAIVAALRGKLLSPTAAPHVATTNLEAYNHYLRGQTLMADRGADNLRAARSQFEAALALDADYVPALAGLARTLALLPSYAKSAAEPPEEIAETAIEVARRALALQPDNAAAYAAIGTANTFNLWRWSEAEQAFARALELAPNDAEIVNFAGDFYRTTQDVPRALAIEQLAVELDPLHAVNRWDLAWAYVGSSDCEGALAPAEAARAMAPERVDSYLILNWCLGRLGRLDEMRRITAEAHRHMEEGEAVRVLLDIRAAMAEGRHDEALTLQDRLRGLVEDGEHQAANLGFQYLLLGESEEAARWLRRAYEQRESDLVFPEPIDLDRIAADAATRDLLKLSGLRELIEIRARNARAVGEGR